MKKFMTIIAVVALVAFAAPAFAANPFADVPAGHWAYDAVAQLAADGLISGYPDGAFKGERQATRYEVAAMVARATAKCESGIQANKKDIELLKKLMVEFKDELDALGAKTDKLDKRVTTLEKGIGSWKISGKLNFNYTEESGDTATARSWNQYSDHQMAKDTARLYFRRQINEDTYFDSEYRIGAWAKNSVSLGMGEAAEQSWQKFYVSTKLPFWGLNMKIGRTSYNFEDQYDLVADSNPLVGGWRVDGFFFSKKWDTLSADFIVGRNSSGAKRNYAANGFGKYNQGGEGTQVYALNLKWTPNDKFTAGLIGTWQQGDGADANSKGESYSNIQLYGLTLGYKFTPNVALKGIYYWQKYSEGSTFLAADGSAGGTVDTNNHAWKVALDVKQDALKFTDLWVEYLSFSNAFGGNLSDGANMYTLGDTINEPGVFKVRPINNETAKVWFVKAEQKWTNKWSTFLRYNHANWGTDGLDNAYDWAIGVKYKLNPAITFMLAYDSINYGDKEKNYTFAKDGKGYVGKDNVILFQTQVEF